MDPTPERQVLSHAIAPTLLLPHFLSPPTPSSPTRFSLILLSSPSSPTPAWMLLLSPDSTPWCSNDGLLFFQGVFFFLLKSKWNQKVLQPNLNTSDLCYFPFSMGYVLVFVKPIELWATFQFFFFMISAKWSCSFQQINLNKAFVCMMPQLSSLGHLKKKEMCTDVLGRTNNHSRKDGSRKHSLNIWNGPSVDQ